MPWHILCANSIGAKLAACQGDGACYLVELQVSVAWALVFEVPLGCVAWLAFWCLRLPLGA